MARAAAAYGAVKRKSTSMRVGAAWRGKLHSGHPGGVRKRTEPA